jgi:hypothetical protein
MKNLIVLVCSLFIISVLSSQDFRSEFQKFNKYGHIGMFSNENMNLLKKQTNTTKQRLDSLCTLSGGLELTSKSVWTYDNQGKIITQISYNWNSSSWIPVRKIDYGYDDQNRLSSQTTSGWESRKPNSWGIQGKYGYTYNAIGLRKTWIIYSVELLSDSTFKFFESSYFEYTYNAKNQIKNFSLYCAGSKMENDDRYYDIHGNDSLRIYTSESNSQKVTYDNTYNGDKIATTLATHGFVRAATGWEPDYRMELTYDTNGNCVSAIDYYWNPTTSAESSLNRCVLRYDTNYSINDVLNVPDLYGTFAAVNKLVKSTIYSSRTGSSVTSVDNYYYSTVEINTAVPTISSDKVSFFPNPVKDFLQISGIDNIKTVLITDLSGKLILNKNLLSANDKIYVGNLAKGMYIVKVITDKKAFQQTIVKQVLKN